MSKRPLPPHLLARLNACRTLDDLKLEMARQKLEFSKFAAVLELLPSLSNILLGRRVSPDAPSLTVDQLIEKLRPLCETTEGFERIVAMLKEAESKGAS